MSEPTSFWSDPNKLKDIGAFLNNIGMAFITLGLLFIEIWGKKLEREISSLAGTNRDRIRIRQKKLDCYKIILIAIGALVFIVGAVMQAKALWKLM